MYKPDYQTLRKQTGFSWSVSCGQSFLIDLAGISYREFNREPKACIEAYRKGLSELPEMFDGDVGLGLCTPGIRYGHVNGFGSELLFPEHGEVAHTHIFASLEEGIGALKKSVDFASVGMAPFYIDFWNQMKQAFPGQPVCFGYGLEGPITTAWELRGEEFFSDLYDNPAGMQEFLTLVTSSIQDFYAFGCSLYGVPVTLSPGGCFMADDVAAMVPPHLWNEFVVPYWDQYYLTKTTGPRSVHVEDLKVNQIQFLEKMGINFWDPCLSRQLTAQIISRECRIPFGWSLQGFDFVNMNHSQIERFVIQAAADGASQVCFGLEWGMANEESIRKVQTFIKTAKEVKRMFDEGMKPDTLMSKAG